MSIPFPLTFVGSKVDEYGVNRNLTNGRQKPLQNLKTALAAGNSKKACLLYRALKAGCVLRGLSYV